MTAAKSGNSRQPTGLLINHGTAVIFMQISRRDYQQNPPLIQEIAASTGTPLL
ncbi:MAG: hypothetical protein ABSG78_14265 [Verrucomicrobiota bacterium]|jgi:hypothetical protein